MPAVGRFSGTPASISASDEPQTVAMDDEPFELGDLGNHPDRVGELGCGRQHRTDRAPGKFAVTDLAPTGRPHAAGLADRVRREVVVEQKPLLVGAVKRVDVLFVFAGAERGHHKRLRLAAGEERGAVGSREHPDLRQDGPDGRQVATVDAPAVVEDIPAHDLGLGVVDRLRDFGGRKLGFAAFRREGSRHLGLDGVDRRIALLFLRDRVSRPEIGLAHLENGLLDLRSVACGKVARLLGRLLGEADDRVDNGLKSGMAGHHCLQHRLFAELLGLQLDHQHGVGGAGDDEIEGRILHLLDRRVDLDLALDHADPGRADGPHERHARQRQGRRSGDQGENVGIRLEIIRQHGRDDLRVAAELVGEKRADRTVDQARHQGFAL